MCSNIKYGNQTIGVGTHLVTISKKGYNYKQWGYDNSWYNARVEKIDSLYKNYDRCYIECNSFFEGGALFGLVTLGDIKLAAVEDERAVLILTKSSIGTKVEDYHKRSAIMLNLPKLFINEGTIVEYPISFLKKVA